MYDLLFSALASIAIIGFAIFMGIMMVALFKDDTDDRIVWCSAIVPVSAAIGLLIYITCLQFWS